MKRAAIAALVILAMGMTALPAFAQTTQGQALGDVYFSALPTEYQPNIIADPFTPFAMYIVMDLDYADIGRGDLNSGVGVLAWEAGISLPGSGSDFIITSAVIRNESLNVGSSTNVICGLSPAVVALNTPIDLMEYTILMPLATPAQDVRVSMGPSTPSSFNPAAPGFNDSQDIGECEIIATGQSRSCLRPFATTRDAVINCIDDCIISVAQPDTWGAIKSNY